VQGHVVGLACGEADAGSGIGAGGQGPGEGDRVGAAGQLGRDQPGGRRILERRPAPDPLQGCQQVGGEHAGGVLGDDVASVAERPQLRGDERAHVVVGLAGVAEERDPLF
jgi:hypothetical protein